MNTPSTGSTSCTVCFGMKGKPPKIGYVPRNPIPVIWHLVCNVSIGQDLIGADVPRSDGSPRDSGPKTRCRQAPFVGTIHLLCIASGGDMHAYVHCMMKIVHAFMHIKCFFCFFSWLPLQHHSNGRMVDLK